MAESVASHPDRPIVCVLCRSGAPFGDADLRRLRQRIEPVVVLEIPVVAPPMDALAAYRRRTLHRAQFALHHKLPIESVVRNLLYSGDRRGAAWKIFHLTYDATEVLRGVVAEPTILTIRDRILAVIGADAPYHMCFSGDRKEIYVLQKALAPMRAIDYTGLLPGLGGGEVHVVGRLQGLALFNLIDAMNGDAAVVLGTVELREPMAPGSAEALTWEETLEAIEREARPDLRSLTANAKHAMKYGQPTPFQRSLVLFKDDLTQHYRECQLISNLCIPLGTIINRYPSSFSPTTGQMMGWTFDHRTQTFVDITLETYYTSQWTGLRCSSVPVGLVRRHSACLLRRTSPSESGRTSS
jgi:hypothetical protein